MSGTRPALCRVVVTGGTSGIGAATARRLAHAGAKELLLVGRDVERGERAARGIAAEAAGVVRFLPADLSSQAEVRALARHLLEDGRPVDVLVNNVGGLYADRWTTVDGHEATLAMNVLNPLLLTAALLPALRAAGPSRVVFVNSGAARQGSVVLEDLEAQQWYRGLDIYARAKLLNAVVGFELARRLPADEVGVLMVDPGGAFTDMTSAMVPRMMPPALRLTWPVVRLVQRQLTPHQAARSAIAAATDPGLTGRTGLWLDTRGRIADPPRQARDADLGRQVLNRVGPLAGLTVARARHPGNTSTSTSASTAPGGPPAAPPGR